jgi:hypothetical protein
MFSFRLVGQKGAERWKCVTASTKVCTKEQAKKLASSMK